MLETDPFHFLCCKNASESTAVPRLSTEEKNAQSMWWSFCCSMASLAMVGVMVFETNQPGSTGITQYVDGTLLERVFLPLFASGVTISMAFVFAVPVVLSGNLTPGRWLVPTGIALTWFLMFYDWKGLINTGRPINHFWRDLRVIIILFKILLPFLLPFFVIWVIFKISARQQKTEKQRTDDEFEQILKAETGGGANVVVRPCEQS